MTEEVIYRFTPPFEGAFLKSVPKRDLTQRDVDRMTGQERLDAFSPHPVTGETLYTRITKAEAKPDAKAAKKDGAE